MKRPLWLALLLLYCINLHAQYELEKEYPLENIQYFYISDSDGVYVNYSIYSSSDSLLLFNKNHQFLRVIVPDDDSILCIINVSKQLCNADDLFEVIYVYQTFENGVRHYHTRIIDENSSLIKSFDDQFMWLMPTADGAKLISQGGVRIYSLPGIFYPITKGEKGEKGDRGAKGLQGIQGEKGDQGDKGDPGELLLRSEFYCPDKTLNLQTNESIFISEPYPNPSQVSSSIDYNISSDFYSNTDYLRALLVFYDITGLQRLSLLLIPSAGSVSISKSLLGTGTFLYRIETSNGFSEVRKLIFD